MKIIQTEQQKEKKIKKLKFFKETETTLSGIHSRYRVLMKGTGRESGSKCIWRNNNKIIVLRKNVDIQVQEVQNIPDRMNPKKSTQRRIAIKIGRVEETSKI